MIRVFSDPRCLGHRLSVGYPEVPERLTVVREELERAGFRRHEGEPHPEERSAVEAIHGQAYVERLRRSVERGDGLFDSSDNPLAEGTWEAAFGAVGACLHAADWVAEGRNRGAFAAVRPPGHHAERQTAMGFCYFNNVAVTARYLQRRPGFGRPAIFDFDVHHGNGTQHLFEEDPEVFFASIHQYPFYPGTGAREERGRGAGTGATLNVPLSAGADDETYREAIQGEVLPALDGFGPDLLLVSAGFDAWRQDPLGGMRVSEAGYRDWGRILGGWAALRCQGRVLALLEGGYDRPHLGGLAASFLAGLSGALPVGYD